MKFLKPLRFQDRIRVDLSIYKIRSAAIVYGVNIFCLGKETEELVLKGNYAAVCCLYSADRAVDPQVQLLNDSFLQKIEPLQLSISSKRL